MTPLALHALALLLLCLHPPHSAAAAAADPTPTPWPHQFHAALLTGYGDRLSSLVNLWYDWPGGRILHDIRSSDEPSYFAQWSNGTTFFYTPAGRACRRSVKAGVGIPRPDWFAPGAAYLGRAPANPGYAPPYDGPDCHVWAKPGFVTYYEDAQTREPVKWVFHTGGSHTWVASTQGRWWSTPNGKRLTIVLPRTPSSLNLTGVTMRALSPRMLRV